MNTPHRFASLLALSAALTACGGASSDKGTTTPPPQITAPISLSLTPLTENVFEPAASVALSANVTVNGNPAPNGTVALFTIQPNPIGTLAPVAPSTVEGVVTTTLSIGSATPITSAFQITATASSNANTASDSQIYYVRPAPKALQVLVPAYFSATGTPSPWTQLTDGATSYPDVQITAIANPGNGVLTAASTADAALATAIAAFKAVPKTVPGISNKVVAYVATASGSSGLRSVADVKATIDNYVRLYPTELDGFFLDGMSTESARLAYFQEIYKHIKGLASSPLVIGNPGTYPVPAYAGVADTLVTYENNAAAYPSIDPQPANTWVYGKDNSAQAMLVHTASTCTSMQAAVQKANRPRMNTGMVYVTNLTIGAPWSALPSYWLELLGTVDALNKQRPLPLC